MAQPWDDVSQGLLVAQRKAQALFAEVVDTGPIVGGFFEELLTVAH
jgi:hypothetical protein